MARPQEHKKNLPQKAQVLLDTFLLHANKSMLHPNDWNRFYRFIWHCTKHNVVVYPMELAAWLEEAGFSSEYASEIAAVFEHGRAILRGKYYK